MKIGPRNHGFSKETEMTASCASRLCMRMFICVCVFATWEAMQQHASERCNNLLIRENHAALQQTYSLISVFDCSKIAFVFTIIIHIFFASF